MSFINHDILVWVIIPILIFCARICDVSLDTLRVIFVINGKKEMAPLLGFFEALIWLIAISQIIQNLHSTIGYFAYAAGFATGNYVGMIIEEKLAMGHVIIRVITRRPAGMLIRNLISKEYRVTTIEGQGIAGRVDIVFAVVKRSQIHKFIAIIKQFNPKAFYTIENVRSFSQMDPDIPYQPPLRRRFMRFLNP